MKGATIMPTISTTLTYLSGKDGYSIYRDQWRNEVYLAAGPRPRRLIHNDDVWDQIGDLYDAYQAGLPRWYDWTQVGFECYLADQVVDPGDIDALQWCVSCQQPGHEEDYTATNNGPVCESCRENYHSCYYCEELFSSLYSTLSDDEVCFGCRDRHYTFCGTCDGYAPDGDMDEYHDHGDEDCDCEAPAQVFAIRNDGHGSLANDEHTVVSLPAGVVSDEGIGEMAQAIRIHMWQVCPDSGDYEERCKWEQLSYRLAEVGQEWQRKDGNFTKRLSRFAYKEWGLKVPPDLLSQIGNLGSAHSGGASVTVAVTRNLNLPRQDFHHHDSCWWTDYASSRCALKSNGGFGLRSFNDYGVTGRAWVMPLKVNDKGNFEPTFETLDPDAFVVFNGYGELSGYVPARVMAHMSGFTYRKVNFECPPMYINSGGYLVAPEAIAQKYTDSGFHLLVEDHAHLYQTEQDQLREHSNV